MPLLGLLTVGSAIALPNAQAQAGESRAGLVIQFADGSVRQYCLAFPGETTTGLDLLLQTGLDVKIEATGGMGGLICKIGPDGCDYPAEHCVCESFGSNGVYWAYHHLKEGRWSTSVLGASSYKVRDGDVEGWAWSEGKPPPLFTFNQICRAEAPRPTPTVPPVPPAPAPTDTSTRSVPTATQPPPSATPTAVAEVATEPPPALPPAPPTTPPTETPRPPTMGPTATLSATLSATATQMSTDTPVPTSTPTATPAIGVGEPSLDPRVIGILAGVGAALGFAVALMLIAARGRREGDGGSDVG